MTMKTKTMMTLACLLVSAPAAAQDPACLALRIAHWTAQGANLALTYHAIDQGAREQNPVAITRLRPMIGIPVVAGTTVAVDYAVQRIHRTHPRTARWIQVALTASSGVILAYELRQAQQRRTR